ncbi:MAG: tail fiber domain-containing protein [Bacteroidia bacterium]
MCAKYTNFNRKFTLLTYTMMRHILHNLLFFCFLPFVCFAQNVGIGTALPRTKLDLNGDLAFRPFNFTVANGQNHNLALNLNRFSYYRLVGAISPYAITGIAGGEDGRVITLQNATNQTLTIANLNAGSLANNQIITAWNGNLLISPNGSVTMYYNRMDFRWMVVSFNSSQQGDWSLQGNSGTNPLVNFIGTTDSKELRFRTNNVEHIRINSQGRIGINSISPQGLYYPYHRIEIQDSNGLSSDIVIRTATGGGFSGVPAWVSMKSNGSLTNPSIVFPGDYLGELYFMGYDGASFPLAAKIDVNIDGVPGLNDMPGRISFFTTPDNFWFPFERLRIDNQGRILFANLASLLDVDQGGSIELGGNNGSNGQGTPYIDFHHLGLLENYNVRLVNADTNELAVKYGGAGLGILRVYGNVIASCGMLVCSDARYKREIKPLSNVIDDLKKINAYTYYYDIQKFPQKGFSEKPQIGLLAQEVEAVYPELVQQEADGYKAIDYAKLTTLLLEAVKQQQVEIEALKKQNQEILLKLAQK